VNKTKLDSIPPMQLKVLELICRGLSSHEVAERLNISFNTVKTHRRLILRRFDVSNTIELINEVTKLENQQGLFSHQISDHQELQPPNILVVEDDLVFRELLVSTLNQMEFECTGVDCQADVEALVRVKCPDVVLLDLNLGDEDGLEIGRMLRRSTPCGIVIMTTRNQIENRLAGLDIGADVYLSKPVDIRELTRVIRNLHARIKGISPVAGK